MGNIKNFFKSVGNWFKNHVPTRRRIIQVYAALLTNANLKDFAEGHIYQSTSDYAAVTKNLCTPGINCYSCPGAVAACPLGSLQNSLGAANKTTPYYIIGIIALFGLLLARTICGFLCPFGFFQDMLYKVKSPKVKKSVYTRLLSYLKYVFLITLVIAVPLIYHNVPGFCKYICPAGTFEGGVGLLSNPANANKYPMLDYLFSWKFILLVICVAASIFIYRAFCRFICPLGAIYGFFNKVALLGVKLEKSKCIDCGMCISKCKMDIRHVGDHECINCGECISVCPTKAISWKGSQLFLEPTSYAVAAADTPAKDNAAPALSSILASGTTMQAATENTASTTSAVETEASVAAEPTAEPEVKAEAKAEGKAPAEKPAKKVAQKRKKSAKILEIVAWSLAVILLIGALIYYNTLPWSAVEPGQQLKNFQAKTYTTAYGAEEQFDLYDAYYPAYRNDEDMKPLIAVFWDAHDERSIEYVDALGELYTEVQKTANVVVIHVADERYTHDDIQSLINEKGWKDYNLPFVQDTTELNVYGECGGTGEYPLSVFFDRNMRISSNRAGILTAEDISSELEDILDTNLVFVVGDRLKNFTVDAFESTYKEKTFSTASARGKVLVVNFWFISCGPCVAELPGFNEVTKKYGDDVAVLAIHSDNSEVSGAQLFIDSMGWSDWGVIFGRDQTGDAIYKSLVGDGTYPMTIIIDTEGYITFVRLGGISSAELNGAIDAALNKE